MSETAKSILKTLVFFDSQDLPLTLMEIRGFLSPIPVKQAVNLSRIKEIIATELKNKVGLKNGFYHLVGREELPNERQNRYRLTLTRYRKARRILWFIRYIPFVRAVAISGSQALMNSCEASDIDLFIITKKHRIWITRMLVSLYFQVIGQRRYRYRTRGRFCLNHYIEEGIKISSDHNFYTAAEYVSLIPVYGIDCLNDFWRDNVWIEDYIACPAIQQEDTFFRVSHSRIQKFVEYILEWFFIAPLFNAMSKKYQQSRIVLQDYVFYSDEELSFHPDSKGQRVLSKFFKKSRKFGLDIVGK